MTGDIDLIGLGWFRLTTDPKKGATFFEFYNDDRWVPLTKQTGEFFATKTLRDRFGGLNTMKNVLGIDKTPPELERSSKAATKLRVNCQQTWRWKVDPWKNFHPWLRIFMLRHGRHHKIPILICENF